MYKEQDIDRRIRGQFQNDSRFNSLRKIQISGCGIRGLYPTTVDFNYPITAIAGKNGSGKSTLLALVSCAFHNTTVFFPLSKIRSKVNYYTFSDFFIFSQEETGPLAEIQIKSNFLTNVEPRAPKIKGEDIRKKKPSGKWNDYNTRPPRVVSFLGINRILPPSENSLYRSYKRRFALKGLNENVKTTLVNALSYIFGQGYTDIQLKEYKNCRLFYVTKNVQYTGYNMGAGENAVLTLLYEIITAGEGALIVIDEIELGIHVSAQKRLIDKLKEFCSIYHSQIVCSTHSQYVLEALPLDARILIQTVGGHTTITQEISPEFALSDLSGANQPELDIFVEDDTAQSFLQNVLSENTRKRVRPIIIGSADNSIPAQMEAHFREGSDNYCVVMDGDKRNKREKIPTDLVKKLADKHGMTDAQKKQYFLERISFLPGTCHPEKYLMQSIIDAPNKDILIQSWDKTIEEIIDFCEQGIRAETHGEFYTLHNLLGLPEQTVIADVLRFYKFNYPNEVQEIENFIKSRLRVE